MTPKNPLVTLGLPVRNGGPMLRAALDSIVTQDHPNLEVVVSDNGSTDETPQILRDYAARFPFVRVVRHETPLTAIDNFMFVLREAKGEFFTWCAHDDTRSSDFVSRLLGAMQDPHILLAFGDLIIWDGVNPPVPRRDYDFANTGLVRWKRLRKAAHMQCYHIYGLWRTDALLAIRYRHTHWWSDLPIMLAAAAAGVFCHVPGPAFRYYEIQKSDAVRAAYQDFRPQAPKISSLMSLLRAVFVTVSRSAGLWPAALATMFTAERYVRYAPRYIVSSLTR